MSKISGGEVRIETVASTSPRLSAGLRVLHSAVIATIGAPIVDRGSWLIVRLSPRVTVSRTAHRAPCHWH